MEIFESLFFLVAAAVFSFVAFKERTQIFIFRSIGLIFATVIILHFNLNWIFKIPMSLNISSLLFISIAVLFLLLDKNASFLERLTEFRKSVTNKKTWIGWLAVLGVLSCAFFVGYSYFEGKLNEPRYSTSDPSIHYLYLSNTAKTGLLSMFAPNEIYVAAGYNQSYESYNDSYLPGPAAAYNLLSNVFFWIKKITLFQVFNIIFYALSSVYLFLLAINHNKKRNPLIAIFILITVLFGTFFDFLATSFTSQLVGLFILLFFIDTFYEYYAKRKISIYIPAIALAGLMFTYFYWLPIAFAFMFLVAFFDIKNVKIRNIMRIILLVTFSSLLSIGYILLVFKLVSVSSATIDGGFPFGPNFLAELVIIAPFALTNLYLLLRDKFLHKKERLLTDFALSVVLYSAILIIAHIFNMASNYVFMKVFYLTVPMIWILCLLFFFEKVSFESIIILIDRIKKDGLKLKTYFSYKRLYLLLGYVIYIAIVTFVTGVDFKVFPVEKNNIELAIERNKKPNLTSQQMKLLTEVANERGSVLENGRILTLAEYPKSVWIFSYSGIWPRTYSLIPHEDIVADELSYLAPNSGINYSQWLLNDENHYLIYLDSDFSKNWVTDSKFDFNDYETVLSVGENHLLRLKNNANVKYFISKKYPDKNQRDSVIIPYSGTFISQQNNLSGLSFLLVIPRNKNILNDYSFELREGDCSMNNAPIVKKTITKDELRNQKTDRSYEISFDSVVPDSKGKMYCYGLSSRDEAETVNLAKDSKTGEILFQERFVYINN